MLTAYDNEELRRVVKLADQVAGTHKALKSTALDPDQRRVRQACHRAEVNALHRAVACAQLVTEEEEA